MGSKPLGFAVPARGAPLPLDRLRRAHLYCSQLHLLLTLTTCGCVSDSSRSEPKQGLRSPPESQPSLCSGGPSRQARRPSSWLPLGPRDPALSPPPKAPSFCGGHAARGATALVQTPGRGLTTSVHAATLCSLSSKPLGPSFCPHHVAGKQEEPEYHEDT